MDDLFEPLFEVFCDGVTVASHPSLPRTSTDHLSCAKSEKSPRARSQNGINNEVCKSPFISVTHPAPATGSTILRNCDGVSRRLAPSLGGLAAPSNWTRAEKIIGTSLPFAREEGRYQALRNTERHSAEHRRSERASPRWRVDPESGSDSLYVTG